MKLFKKSFRSLSCLTLIVASLFFAGCGSVKEKENNASASFVSTRSINNEKYVIDIKESIVTYKGSMAVGLNSHTGYVQLSKGELMIDNGQLVGGAVEVDMNTIADIKHGSENGLVLHLKSPDFFDVEKFPSAAFAITVVVSATSDTVNVTGNLTIKGITHAVTFPANIEVKGGIVKANGKLIIDRTKWDVRYKSGKFFDTLADEAISDNIEFEMKIVAKK